VVGVDIERDIKSIADFIANSDGDCVVTVGAPDNHVVVVIPPGVSIVFIGDEKVVEGMLEQATKGNRWRNE
jgi:soluble P-type ATPase